MTQFGRSEPVTDLRTIWQTEVDFSDWLISEEGLKCLAQDLGIRIANPFRERQPGNYRCDITGHAVGDENHVIVIENQFGKTNHNHLGKLLTYAAVHAASTIIWISEKVSGDHCEAVNWLNDNTPSTVSFYLACIEVRRINDGLERQLKIECSPTQKPNIQRSLPTEHTSDRNTWPQIFWDDILGYINQQRPPFRLASQSDKAYATFVCGRSDFWFGLTTEKPGYIACELCFKPAWRADALAQLKVQRSEIEEEIGAALDWEFDDGKKIKIVLEKKIDPRDEANRDEIKEWMHEYSLRFDKVFRSRVHNLIEPIHSIEAGHEQNAISFSADFLASEEE